MDLGVEQTLPDLETDESALNVGINQWHELNARYIEKHVLSDERLLNVLDQCRNDHNDCTLWATIGECNKNKGYMHKNCRLACRMCHHALYEYRCPYDGSTEGNVWKKGDLDTMFERIVTDQHYQQYNPRILSGPDMATDSSVATSDNDKNEQSPPWLIVLDDFLSAEEAQKMIDLGHARGYERSVDVGERQEDGSFGSHIGDGRTSSNTWCLDECYNDATTRTILARIENVTGIPDAHSEYLQILQYQVGQFYGTHHDFTFHTGARAEGVRLLTFFLYLNDVEEGGETDFPTLGISVTPKTGRAVLWPSVLNDDPNSIDQRTDHQALPVKKGVKYAVNAWIHMRDFKEAYGRDCVH